VSAAPCRVARLRFRITLHSGYRPPEDALDLLFARLGGLRDGVRFSQLSSEIRATLSDEGGSRERDELEEIGRGQVLEIVKGVCDRAPELQADWFAVAAVRR
jgi:hypothetical protein